MLRVMLGNVRWISLALVGCKEAIGFARIGFIVTCLGTGVVKGALFGKGFLAEDLN